MKNVLLPLLMVLTASSISLAQLDPCVPDQTYADSALGVYPAPFDTFTNPLGGITDSAYLNLDYQFVFTTVVGDTFNFNNTPYTLDSITILEITGLPEGFLFSCDDTTNTFLKNELGCAMIHGTATNPADVGRHELFISATLYTPDFPIPIPITFPNPFQLGHYYLFVLLADNLFELASEFESVRNLPNPFSTTTIIEVNSRESGSYQFQVADMLGQVVHTRSVYIEEGRNQIEFDGSDLPTGLYLYTFSNGYSQVTKKMLIGRK